MPTVCVDSEKNTPGKSQLKSVFYCNGVRSQRDTLTLLKYSIYVKTTKMYVNASNISAENKVSLQKMKVITNVCQNWIPSVLSFLKRSEYFGVEIDLNSASSRRSEYSWIGRHRKCGINIICIFKAKQQPSLIMLT